ncbi:VOC family protein [Pandoraea sp. PE-S2T-3]|uniref:VOC family protein n=1 Tax=Pandoraea sp. PE-S2T-3 TaxID=1986993 RepID=UPI000B406C18|nr:VOC family protein [Pandoraea sp. PE-S2T-3]
MIDHMEVMVSDFATSRAFYRDALAAIGYSLIAEKSAAETGNTDIAGYGENGHPDFWISRGTPNRPALHVAFRVPARHIVDAFHRAAVAAGGTDNGGPGLRERYGPNYYAAFVIDPDGHNIEAVCYASD